MKRKIALLLTMMLLLTGACACGKSKETEKTKKKKVEKKSSEEEDDETKKTKKKETDEDEDGKDTNADFSPDVTFTITDRNGKDITESVFAEHELTMINFWEPWCGPCVQEMPEIEKLYEDYKDKGLMVIGVYSTEDMEADVEAVLADAGTTYPICFYSKAFDAYQSGYVPTTIFVDKNGHVITMSDGEPYVVGSNSYEAWAQIVEKNL